MISIDFWNHVISSCFPVILHDSSMQKESLDFLDSVIPRDFFCDFESSGSMIFEVSSSSNFSCSPCKQIAILMRIKVHIIFSNDKIVIAYVNYNHPLQISYNKCDKLR